jgi:hypothetical protein
VEPDGVVHERTQDVRAQHHYQLKEGGWTQIIQGRLAFFRAGLEVAEYGFRAVGNAPPQRLARLEEYRDLLTFMEKEGGEELFHRWERYREERRAARRTAPEDTPT